MSKEQIEKLIAGLSEMVSEVNEARDVRDSDMLSELHRNLSEALNVVVLANID